MDSELCNTDLGNRYVIITSYNARSFVRVTHSNVEYIRTNGVVAETQLSLTSTMVEVKLCLLSCRYVSAVISEVKRTIYKACYNCVQSYVAFTTVYNPI